MIVRGTITQTSPLRVVLDASVADAPATKGSTYTPVLADRVLVAVIDRSLVVLDKEV